MAHYRITRIISRTFLLFGLIFSLFSFSESTLASKLNEPEVDRTPAGARWWAGIWSPEATADEIYSYIEKNSKVSNRWIILDFDGREVVVLWWKGFDTEVKSREWLTNPLRTGYYTGPSPNDSLGNMKGIVEKIREKIKIEIVYIPNIAGNQNFPSTVSLSATSKPQSQTQDRTNNNTNQTLNYSHGKYVGDVMNGKAQGYGTYTSAKSGTVYKGQFIADTFSGDGTMTWTNGSKFVGKWQNDVGVSGTMTYANGSTTSGTVRTGVFTPSSVQSPQSQSQPSQPQANIDVEIKYADGAIYVGQIKDGKSDGKGTLTQISGDRYVGEFKDGLKDGQGTMSVANGNRYVGQYKNDMRSGQGTFTWKNGDHYVGEYKNNMRNGRGTFTWNDGSRYVGEYKDGNENGQGTLTWANGNRYAGEWKGGLRDGQGALTGANGNRYVGKWKDGEENGEGIFTWPNGARYVGEFKDGKRTGQGTFTWANRDRYVGQFKDNEMNGQGTLTLADGGSYIGEFKNGKEDGQGTFIWKDGTSYVGQFKNGEMNGKGTEMSIDGNGYVGEFKDDERNGQGTLTWANGDRYVGEFKNDMRDGRGIFTSKDGTKQVGLFKDDIFVGSQTNSQSTSNPSQPQVNTDLEEYKIRITAIRREIEKLQKHLIILDINNMPNDPTKNIDLNKINDMKKLSGILSEMSSTRDSLKELLDKSYSQASSLKILQ